MTDATKSTAPNICPPDKDAALILSDGSVFWGKGAGAKTTATGEVCFNTSLTGYQEILTDPSYAGQIITFTFPHIGNVGTNPEDIETVTPAVRGCVMGADITAPSNWRAAKHLDEWLISYNLAAVTGIDTRRLTRRIRDVGFANATIVYADGEIDVDAAIAQAKDFAGLEGMDLAKDVTCAQTYSWDESIWSIQDGYGQQTSPKRHVVAMDFGAKRNILRCLAAAGCKVTVVPASTSADDILALNPDGVFLSNGPGDPAATGEYAVPTIKALIEKNLPIFGICLGHQMLSLALGAKTKKMHHGHRGANHPVKDLETSKVEITSQNHGFVVESDSLPNGVVETHRSLFDGTLEGIRLNGKPIFSVQHHPEASPGPQDSHYLFDRFVKMMEG
ncbi:MAG: glutamine-hydrolyzing carbamoyl-phosphate synthase small subunit [Rhodospirillaceae bacterium]|jgi:carbamoyl-phosphate synthase small subunit|nr:glutamine-hydrolyzing carbamoyl-phosphate synthase small subunit [Rhodospirillaceae bacterium]MBT4589858.1 glutamine-hydrolyzing carbamoyl-phosphate synthase small subunit [Rhodospirillaceae bacterium]MBT4938493.1 glutamine-hydrolyzing carbamoyl-phosphate synthase small subunit [Rhodospirillaceae bacterium]MBT5939152.1 glutamine-hydrolyzing carbamoyl-phosphate synthase small subunit [Rhodospirillaceae bacterium]MBT7267441.1 glutamine-hydrolyzing carbamoyl-phosphate synthase small subunit [Rh